MSGQGPSYTATDVATEMGIAVDRLTTQINIAGKTPDDLINDNHDIGVTYYIKGITPEDFIEERGGSAFSLSQMEADFSTICRDYTEDLASGVASRALDFCAKVIYEIGPESRKVGETKRDKTWRILFTYRGTAEAPIVKAAFVSTYKINQTYKPKTTEHSITLSVKHATLLAMKTYAHVVEFACNMTPSRILLTPLAGAIFCPTDVVDMACILGVGIAKVIRMINESCQSSGHYLPNSNASCALAAAYASTKGLIAKGKHDIRASILNKTARQYYNAKKDFTKNHFALFCVFASGGVPPEMTIKSLNKTFKAASKVDIKELKAREKSEVVASADLQTKIETLQAAGVSFTVENTADGRRKVTSTRAPSAGMWGYLKNFLVYNQTGEVEGAEIEADEGEGEDEDDDEEAGPSA